MTLLLALGALTLVLGTWIAYLSTIPRGKVPQNPHLYTTVLLVGAGVASAALWLRTGSGLHRAGVYAAAGLSLVLVATWLVLMARRKTPASTLKVKVGDPVLPFVTAQSDGTSFDLASLRGQRYLFNFFRGSWCPYC